MRSISQVSFVKRATAVLTASMFLLSGIVLTAGPANAASTETVPYSYTVKVPVTKTVYEYKVTKSVVNKRTVYTYERVAKTKTEYRVETRTGYREAPVKVADKPAAAQFKVQVAPTAAFQNITKEIVVTPATSGTNKVNLSSQLAGNVGDVAYVRVVARNAAGKSTAGRVSKLAFGEVSRSNYDVQVPYTETGSRVVQNAYYQTVTDYGNPQYRADWIAPTYRDELVPATYITRTVAFRNYYWDTQAYTAYRSESYTYYTTEQYYVSGTEAYSCDYWNSTTKRIVSKTCYRSKQYGPYSRSVANTGTRQVAYTAYRDVKVYYDDTRQETVLIEPAYWQNVQVSPGYYNYVHIGYGTKQELVPAVWENYNYTAYRTETRTAITNGWKASN